LRQVAIDNTKYRTFDARYGLAYQRKAIGMPSLLAVANKPFGFPAISTSRIPIWKNAD
jgi:hypothetical protein